MKVSTMKLLWPIPTCLLKDPNKPQTVEVEVPYLHAKDVVCGEKMAVLTRDHAPWGPPMDETRIPHRKGKDKGKRNRKGETEDDAAEKPEKPCTDIQNQIGGRPLLVNLPKGPRAKVQKPSGEKHLLT